MTNRGETHSKSANEQKIPNDHYGKNAQKSPIGSIVTMEANGQLFCLVLGPSEIL